MAAADEFKSVVLEELPPEIAFQISPKIPARAGWGFIEKRIEIIKKDAKIKRPFCKKVLDKGFITDTRFWPVLEPISWVSFLWFLRLIG